MRLEHGQVPDRDSGNEAPFWKTNESHLTLGLIGEGKMWSPKTGISDAKTILDEYHLEPIRLDAGEGIALINGTTYTHTLAIEALNRTGTRLKLTSNRSGRWDCSVC